MALVAEFTFAETGITVPYEPCFEGIRANSGFTDLRGHPELVAGIPEAQRSRALSTFLHQIAVDEDWISLGCDLGHHIVTEEGRHLYLAGGYVQFTFDDFFKGYDFYQRLAEGLYNDLFESAAANDWRISFQIGDVRYKLEREETDIASLYVWFDAAAATLSDAEAARERLIDALRISLLEPVLAPLDS